MLHRSSLGSRAKRRAQRDAPAIRAAVLEAVRCQDVLALHGLSADRAGFARCPIHGDETGSLKIYPHPQGWFCFGCQKGGNAIDLMMHLGGLGYWDALRQLDAAFGLGLLEGGAADPQQAAQLRRQIEEEQQRADALEALLWDIALQLRAFHALPPPRPGEHGYAARYGLMAAYAEELEAKKEEVNRIERERNHPP